MRPDKHDQFSGVGETRASDLLPARQPCTAYRVLLTEYCLPPWTRPPMHEHPAISRQARGAIGELLVAAVLA